MSLDKGTDYPQITGVWSVYIVIDNNSDFRYIILVGFGGHSAGRLNPETWKILFFVWLFWDFIDNFTPQNYHYWFFERFLIVLI